MDISSPILSITILSALLIIALLSVAIFLPRRGLLARWRARRRLLQRQLLEDALKLIFNLGQEGAPPDRYRLAVELKLDLRSTQALIARLEAQGLAAADQGRLLLTPEGRRWAVQVIRAHRLWERYLADEARMPLEQVHTAAHRREHRMSVEEVNALDAALGHPARDPHGDPIPSAAGDLRRAETDLNVTALQPGQRGRITQLEDEPPLAYAQLLAEGLYVGQEVVLQEVALGRVVLSGADRDYNLAPSIAENIFVHPEPLEQPVDLAVIPLSKLPSRVKAEVVRIDQRCQGFTRRRFLDLGLTPGAVIYPELDNPFKDPRAYRVRSTLIALRSEQASLIYVKPALS